MTMQFLGRGTGDRGGRSGPAPWRPLHIAMIGQKGLPATYGGIEHHVQQIGRRLVERGHRVTVFCRSSYGRLPGPTYLGMELRMAPTVGTKHLDAIVHSGSSSLLALASRCDVVHYHGLGPGFMAPLPRYLSGARVVLTVHGLDHQRAKWGRAAQTMMSTAHWMSGHVPDRTVTVSRALSEHYRTALGRQCDYIPNGVDAPSDQPPGLVEELGLAPGRYALFVGRLVPEKRPDLLLRAFRDVPGDHRLVVVGDSSFTDGYAATLRELAAADPRVLLPGYLYGDQLAALYRHAAVFVQPSALEGLPLTLLEAASHGAPVLTSDIAPHLEVLGSSSGAGHRLFPEGDREALTATLGSCLAAPDAEREAARELRADVLERYSWTAAVDALEAVYLGHPIGVPSADQPQGTSKVSA